MKCQDKLNYSHLKNLKLPNYSTTHIYYSTTRLWQNYSFGPYLVELVDGPTPSIRSARAAGPSIYLRQFFHAWTRMESSWKERGKSSEECWNSGERAWKEYGKSVERECKERGKRQERALKEDGKSEKKTWKERGNPSSRKHWPAAHFRRARCRAVGPSADLRPSIWQHWPAAHFRVLLLAGVHRLYAYTRSPC